MKFVTSFDFFFFMLWKVVSFTPHFATFSFLSLILWGEKQQQKQTKKPTNQQTNKTKKTIPEIIKLFAKCEAC